MGIHMHPVLDDAPPLTDAPTGGEFCVRCGRAMPDGDCAACTPSSPVPPAPAPTPAGFRIRRPRAAAAVVAGALCLLTAATATAWYRVADLTRTTDATAKRQDATIASLQAQLRGEATSVGGLTDRLKAVESTVGGQFDAVKLAQKVAPSVFEVDAGDAIGTAWVIHSGAGSSQLVTNYHVVRDVYVTGKRSVAIVRGTERFPAQIAAVDETRDLALLSVAQDFPALAIANTVLQVGDPVLVIGSSVGLEGSVTSGLVSAVDRSVDGQSYIQFSAPISPGNSGGPVVDRSGQVIGVTDMKNSQPGAEGVDLAIPAATVCRTVTTC